MRIFNRLLCVALVVAGATASAGTVTRNPRDYALGTDVSTAFPGVTLTLLDSVGGSTTYAPAMSPVTIADCAGYAGCDHFNNAYTLATSLHGAMEYRTCYDATRLGHTSGMCGTSWSVLQAMFTTPTDFVEFHWTTLADPPILMAYDAAGNEIAACGPFGPTTCMTTNRFVPGYEFMGTIRVTASGANKISRVVIAGFSAQSRVYLMQYDFTKSAVCPVR